MFCCYKQCCNEYSYTYSFTFFSYFFWANSRVVITVQEEKKYTFKALATYCRIVIHKG